MWVSSPAWTSCSGHWRPRRLLLLLLLLLLLHLVLRLLLGMLLYVLLYAVLLYAVLVYALLLQMVLMVQLLLLHMRGHKASARRECAHGVGIHYADALQIGSASCPSGHFERGEDS